MAISSLPIDDASPEQRRAFVRDFLNLEVAPNASDDEVLASIQRAAPGTTTIFIQDTAPQPDEPVAGVHPADTRTPEQEAMLERLRPEEVGAPVTGSLGKNDPRSTIVIPTVETDDGTGAMDVTVGVNGIVWQIKRGVEVSVPQRVIEALNNTVATSLRHEQQHDGEVLELRSDAKRVNFFYVEKAPAAAVDQWRKDTAAMFNP